MKGKINYGVHHEHVKDFYELKHPEKLLSDLTDSSETDSESSNDERSFDDSDTDLNDPESEKIDKNNKLNRFMSHVDAIFNETNNRNYKKRQKLGSVRLEPNRSNRNGR